MTSGGAPILYFLHIFKTGGTTFRSLLRSNYRPEHLFTGPILARVGEDGRARTPDCHDADVREVVARIQAAQGTLRAAAASLAYGIHRHLERPIQYVSFMREPVSRCRSIWHFAYERRHDRAFWSILQGHGLDLDRVLSATDESIMLRNDQVRMLTGSAELEVGHEALELARERIARDYLMVGAVERYDDCLRLFAPRAGWTTLAYTRRNVGAYPRRARLPPDAERRFRDANEWDVKLHAWLLGEYLPGWDGGPGPA